MRRSPRTAWRSRFTRTGEIMTRLGTARRFLLVAVGVTALGSVVAGAAGAQVSARAQALSGDRLRAQFEPSYVTALGGLGMPDPLLFEGNLAPAFFVSVARTFAVAVTPKVVVRMIRTESLPVRSPSFMPRLHVYVPVGSADRVDDYFTFMVSHHSNGQEGPFLHSDGSRNHDSGNFSTNFVQLGFQGALQGRPLAGLDGYALAAEYHPEAFMDDALEGLYSPVRLHASVRRGLPRDLGLTVSLTGTIGGEVPDSDLLPDRLHLWTALDFRPPFADEFAFFVNAYSGQDYYNMRFDRRLNVLRIGIATRSPRDDEVRSQGVRGVF